MKKYIAAFMMIVMLMSSAMAAETATSAAAQSVWLLEVYDENDEIIATGSGFVAFDGGTLITNEHVIEDAAYIIAYSEQSEKPCKLLKLKAVDPDRDVAILEFDAAANAAPLTVDAQSRLAAGQTVTAVGSPEDVAGAVSIGSITDTAGGMPDYIQFTASEAPGSGGVLLDESGAVVGLCVSHLRESGDLYYAIPMKYVEEMYLDARSEPPVTLAEYNDLPRWLAAAKLRAPKMVAGKGVKLNWSGVGLAEAYEVYRRADSSDDFSLIGTVQETSFTDPDVVSGETYEYCVTVIHGWREAAASNKVKITLQEKSAQTKADETKTADSAPAAKVIYTTGDRNEELKGIKVQLYRLGYYAADAVYDDQFDFTLSTAVKTFQSQNDLPQTGEMDETTLAKLLAGNAKRGRLPVPQEIWKYTKNTYELWDVGEDVILLKEKLQDLGYYLSSSTFDNDYNRNMVDRVKQFQKNNQIDVTGVVDEITLIKLYDKEAVVGQWYSPSSNN